MSHENPYELGVVNKGENIQGERIALIKEGSCITADNLFEIFGQDKPIVACDFYVDGIEFSGKQKTHGLDYKNIINIDHHAPIEAMERQISSATLAIDYVNNSGVQEDCHVVVNHTDCDSVLSSSIVRGVLPPEKIFSDAAIAADHTGEPNDIADLLQSLGIKRDIDFSLRNLDLLLRGERLEPEAEKLFIKRQKDRQRAREFVEGGAFNFVGKVAYANSETNFDGAFLPALLKDSFVIILGSPFRDISGDRVEGVLRIAIRLGQNVPKGLTLHSLGIKDLGLGFGGRWNAGNNKRSGGTRFTIEQCAQMIAKAIDLFIAHS